MLLRGLTREARHWGAFTPQLQAALPGARVVALDLPGNGRLHARASPASVGAMADECRAALRAQGLAPPYRVIAMSMGAMVTLAWAQAQPHELAAAVLINTSLRGLDPFHQRLRPGQYVRLLRLALTDPLRDPAAWERSILRMTSHIAAADPAVAAALLRDWTAWRVECPVSRRNALAQLHAAARYRAPAQPPPVPLLLLAGARDALVDPRCSRRLAALWRLPIAEHPGAGHDLPLDDGTWVAQQVAGFFGDAAQRRGG